MNTLLCSSFYFLANVLNTISSSGESNGNVEGIWSTGSGSGSDKQEFFRIPLIIRNSKATLTLAFLVCDQEQTGGGEFNHNLTLQIRQLIVSLKSIALAEKYSGNIVGGSTGQQRLDIKLIVNRRQIFDHVENTVGKWGPKFRNFLQLSYVPAVYPKGYEWMDKEFKPCAATRLFLDQILKGTDSAIYADTDTLFLNSVQHLWAEFTKFKEETVAAMTPELDPKRGRKIKKYNSNSYNSGPMLMNLTRMRAIEWTERLGMISKLFLKETKFGDQGMLINYFKHFPRQLQNLPRRWNFSPRNCKFSRKLSKSGISAVHLFNQKLFEGPEMRSFQRLFAAYEELDLKDNFMLRDFTQQIKTQTFDPPNSNASCDASPQFRDLVIKSIQQFEQFKASSAENILDNFKETGIPLTASLPAPIPPEVPEKMHSQEMVQTECINVCLIYCDPPRVPGETTHVTKQFNETVVLLKSMVLLEKISPNPKCINAIIMGDDVEAFNGLVSRIMESWNSEYTKLLRFNFVTLTYSKDFAWMKEIFRPCSALRLNYANLLPNYDAVMHLDTDMIFIRPVSELWSEFDNFSNETIMMMTSQFNHKRSEQISKKYYWPTKYQGGVMLMNLTRMRSIGFPTRTNMIATFFRKELILPTQVTVMIYFHHFPEQISLLDCSWSFLPYYCNEKLRHHCSSISVIHAVNRTFSPASFEPVYHQIFLHYQTIDMKNPAANPLLQTLTNDLEIEFDNITSNRKSRCSSPTFRRMFTHNLKKNARIGEQASFNKN